MSEYPSKNGFVFGFTMFYFFYAYTLHIYTQIALSMKISCPFIDRQIKTQMVV